MAVSDDDGTAERLAQTRAQRRRMHRLGTAGRRDAAHERTADRKAEREAETGYHELSAHPMTPGETREQLATEQDALALERAELGRGFSADLDVEAGIEMDI